LHDTADIFCKSYSHFSATATFLATATLSHQQHTNSNNSANTAPNHPIRKAPPLPQPSHLKCHPQPVSKPQPLPHVPTATATVSATPWLCHEVQHLLVVLLALHAYPLPPIHRHCHRPLPQPLLATATFQPLPPSHYLATATMSHQQHTNTSGNLNTAPNHPIRKALPLPQPS
jgi:hypothetical protein